MSSIGDISHDKPLDAFGPVPKRWLEACEFEPMKPVPEMQTVVCTAKCLHVCTCDINWELANLGAKIPTYPPYVAYNAKGQVFEFQYTCADCGEPDSAPQICRRCEHPFCKECLKEHHDVYDQHDKQFCEGLQERPQRKLRVAIDVVVKQGSCTFPVQVWCLFEDTMFEVQSNGAATSASAESPQEESESKSAGHMYYELLYNISSLRVLLDDNVLTLPPGTPLSLNYQNRDRTWVIVAASFAGDQPLVRFAVPSRLLEFVRNAGVIQNILVSPMPQPYDTKHINVEDIVLDRSYRQYKAILNKWAKLFYIEKTNEQIIWDLHRSCCLHRFEQLRAKLKDSRMKRLAQHKQKEAVEKQLVEKEAEAEDWKRLASEKNKTLKEQHAEIEKKNVKIAEMLGLLTNVEATTKTRIDQMQSLMRDKLDEAQRAQDEFAKETKKRAQASAQAKIDKAKQEMAISIQQANDDIAGKNKEIARQQKEITRKQEEMARTEEEIARQKAELHKVADGLSAQLEAKDAELKAKQKEIGELADKLEQLELECGQCFLHMQLATRMCKPCGHLVLCEECVREVGKFQHVTWQNHGVTQTRIFPASSACVCPVPTCAQLIEEAVEVRRP